MQLISVWKDVDPKGYEAAKEAMSAWFSKRLEELQLENLKQLSENIKNGKKLQKGVRQLPRHTSPEEG